MAATDAAPAHPDPRTAADRTDRHFATATAGAPARTLGAVMARRRRWPTRSPPCRFADIAPGTRIDLIRRRAARTMPRPVDALAMRARFDLRIEMEREGDRLVMRRIPTRSTTPRCGFGPRRRQPLSSARAGAPPAAIQSYLRSSAARSRSAAIFASATSSTSSSTIAAPKRGERTTLLYAD